MLGLSTLAIKMLLKCNEKSISMRDVTQFYKSYGKDERDKAIIDLLNEKYIESIQMPRPNTKKTPTFYSITLKGKKWVAAYLSTFNE